MVNENNLRPIIENKKPFELVQEIENYQIKKSPLSPAARAKVIKRNGSGYQSSRISSEDIALMQMYGPGFWDDFGGFIIKTAATTAAAGAIVATGGTAAPLIGAGMWASGKVAEEVGKGTDNSFLRSVGSFTKDTGFGAITGGLLTGEGAVRTAIKNGWSLDKVEKINKFFEIKGYAEGGLAMTRHQKHKDRGISYERGCEICNL